MTRSAKKNKVRMVRSICSLTQSKLARILGCARLTVVALETGKLKLSERMAQQMAVHLGVSEEWLLNPDMTTLPTASRQPDRPFSTQIYLEQRQAVLAQKVHPLDVIAIKQVSEDFCGRLRHLHLQAYKTGTLVAFYFRVRSFLEESEEQGRVAPTAIGEAELADQLEAERAKQEAEQKKASRPTDLGLARTPEPDSCGSLNQSDPAAVFEPNVDVTRPEEPESKTRIK